jgi:hypothetical protein
LEFVREIRGGRLVLKIRGTGPPGALANRLQFSNPGAIQSLQADVRLNAYTEPEGLRAAIALSGSFYSDGTGSPGSEVGDVLANIGLIGDSSGVTVYYLVFKCTNADCSSWTELTRATVKAAALGRSTPSRLAGMAASLASPWMAPRPSWIPSPFSPSSRPPRK